MYVQLLFRLLIVNKLWQVWLDELIVMSGAETTTRSSTSSSPAAAEWEGPCTRGQLVPALSVETKLDETRYSHPEESRVIDTSSAEVERKPDGERLP